MTVVLFGLTSDEEFEGLTGTAYFFIRIMLVALLLVLSIVGAIVGVVIRLVS